MTPRSLSSARTRKLKVKPSASTTATAEAGPRSAARAGAREWQIPDLLVKATLAGDIVTVPARRALAIDGAGSPMTEIFQQAVGAVYGVTYTLKFARKASGRGTPFKVAPLEGRWGAEGWTGPGTPPPERWVWRLRLCVPPDVTAEEAAEAVRVATTKKGGKLEGSDLASRVFLEEIPEQRFGRILHVGAYADEPRSFATLARVIEAAGLRAARAHVEIYLGDPRRSSPDKLKTVLLKKVAPADAAATLDD